MSPGAKKLRTVACYLRRLAECYGKWDGTIIHGTIYNGVPPSQRELCDKLEQLAAEIDKAST